MYNLAELIRNHAFMEGFNDSLRTGAPPPLLRDAKIKLTSRCNLRCVMCKYWQTRGEEALASDRWREVFSEMAALGCRKVHFSGGEVFLRPDFLDLAEDAVNKKLKVNMTTNGTLIDRERARRIADIGINAVSISLDGPDRKSHEAVRRRPLAFKRSLKAIHWIKKFSSKVKVRVNFVIMRSNFRQVPEMVELAGKLGAENLVAMPVDEKGPRVNRLSRSQIREYNRDIAPLVAERRRRRGLPTTLQDIHPFGVTENEIALSSKGMYARGYFERRTCLAPWLHLFMAWDGNSYLCCMTNGRMESLGNVGRQSVRSVFHGEPMQRIRREFRAGRHLPTCQRCDLFLKENSQLDAALTG